MDDMSLNILNEKNYPFCLKEYLVKKITRYYFGTNHSKSNKSTKKFGVQCNVSLLPGLKNNGHNSMEEST